MRARSIFVGVAILSVILAVNTASTEELYISEYVEGSSLKYLGALDLAIEIFNPTPGDIDLGLASYYIYIYADGAYLSPTHVIALSGIINSGATWVIANSGASSDLTALADQLDANLLFDGNDAILLLISPPKGPPAHLSRRHRPGRLRPTAWLLVLPHRQLCV